LPRSACIGTLGSPIGTVRLLDWEAVPTRRLIAIALVCGLAILIAGGIQLVRLRPERLQTLALDHPATVGGAVVNPKLVVDPELKGTSADAIHIRFDVTAGDSPLAEPLVGWRLLATTPLKPKASSRCLQAEPLGPHQQTSCTLEFDRPTGRAVASYVLVYGPEGSDPAQWTVKT
jgi:hypothetical protein